MNASSATSSSDKVGIEDLGESLKGDFGRLKDTAQDRVAEKGQIRKRAARNIRPIGFNRN